MSIQRVAVVGGGTMGNGIAHVCAQGGKDVRLIDVSPQVLEQAVQTIGKNLDRQLKKGTLTAEERQRVLDRVRPVTSLEAGVDGVDLVVEAVPEKPSLKFDLFQKLDASAPA